MSDLSIREHANSIPDAAVDDLPTIRHLLAELDAAEAEHRRAVETRATLERKIADIRAERDAAAARADSLAADRGRLLAAILLGEAEPALDREHEAERKELQAFIVRTDLALPHVARRLDELQIPVGNLALRIENLGGEIRQLRQTAKLDIAKRQAA
ncbi:MAG: hypothetical protein AB7F89_08795 [Pirellulaceae bacterium]